MTTADAKFPCQPDVEYREFVAATASKVPSFQRLHAFLQSGCLNCDDLEEPRGITKISYIAFGEKELPTKPIDVKEENLEKSLAEDKEGKLYIVENISPSVAALFGGTWNVDPQFFLDYLDDAPWWRIVDVEPHLDALPSVRKTQSDHIAFSFVASREFHAMDASEPPRRIPDRLEAVQLAGGMKKIGGGLNPIPRDGREFHPVGLIRRAVAVWFGPDSSATRCWKKCVILLDPPFKTSDDLGLVKLSKYRTFTSRPMMSSVQDRDIDDRASYRTTLLHCFRHNGLLDQEGIPHPLLLLQDLYRLVASEWVALHTYIERDLSTIEWRLENEKNTKLEVLESFLERLFTFRRRFFKYGRLLDEQLQSILTDHPVTWDGGQSSIEHAKQMLAADFAHVQRLFNANATRINQIFSIIMPLISIRDSRASIAQNRSLGFLTALATVLLPFNAVAAILAIPSPYGLGGEGFWVFWAASGVVCIVVLVSFLVYSVVFNGGAKNETTTATRRQSVSGELIR